MRWAESAWPHSRGREHDGRKDGGAKFTFSRHGAYLPEGAHLTTLL